MKFLLNPYALIGALIAISLVCAASYRLGYKHAENECAAEKAISLSRAIEQANAIAIQDAEILTTHEQSKERIRTVFQTIREEVTLYAKNHSDDECLDPDGLRIWRAANSGTTEAQPTAKPDTKLP